MHQTCAARLPSGDRCDQPATTTDRELLDVVCFACAQRLDQARWHRSYHEAGHAIAFDQVGAGITSVSIRAQVPWHARATLSPRGEFSAEERCLCLLAGGIAEEYAVKEHGLGAFDPAGSELDVAYAARCARSVVRDASAVEPYLETIRANVNLVITDRRVELEALATALFERIRLSGEEVTAIIGSATPAP